MGLFLPGNDRRWASYDLEVAEKLGLNEAIVLAQIIRSIECHIDDHSTDRFFRDGRWWMYDSMPALSKSTALGIDAIRRTITRLKSLKILQSIQFELSLGYGRYWYTIDSEALSKNIAVPPPKQNQRVGGGTLAKPEGAPVQNQRVEYAKPEGGTLAKPHGLSITPNTNISIDHTITQPTASVIALPVKKPRSKKQPKQVSEPFLELGKKWLDFSQRKSKSQNPRWTPESFGEALERTAHNAKVTVERLTQALNYLEGDVFWTKYAHSPKTLLVISKTQDKYRINQILDSMDEDATGKKPGGLKYERPKAVDYSADNGKFATCRDDKPW